MSKWAVDALQVRAQDRVADDAAEFHERTKWSTYNILVESLRIKAFLADPKASLTKGHGKSYFNRRKIELHSSPLNGSLQEALDRRESFRGLSSKPLSDDILRGILMPVCERDPIDSMGRQTNRRPHPSAGGMFPTEVYVLRPFDHDGQQSFALYNVDARNKCLNEIRSSISQSEVSSSLGAGRPSRIPSFGAAILLTSVLGRSTGKYGARGYRFALLEAGHLAQNILLACSSLKLPSYCYGGYLDNPTSDLLRIDGVEEVPIHCILCGFSTDTTTGEIIDV